MFEKTGKDEMQEALKGPAIFSNRIIVSKDDGLIRIGFLENGVFRAAIIIQKKNAEELEKALAFMSKESNQKLTN